MLPKYGLTLSFLFALASFSGLHSQSYFSDVTEQSGIEHIFITYQGTFGGGACVIDYNDDGYQDLFITGGSAQNVLVAGELPQVVLENIPLLF